MYPVPPKPETQGRTEIALGKWLKTRTRHNVVVATKVSPPPPRPERLLSRVMGCFFFPAPLLLLLLLLLPLLPLLPLALFLLLLLLPPPLAN